MLRDIGSIEFVHKERGAAGRLARAERAKFRGSFSPLPAGGRDQGAFCQKVVQGTSSRKAASAELVKIEPL